MRTERGGRWAFFFGAGPAINFVKLGFAREGDDVEEDFEAAEETLTVAPGRICAGRVVDELSSNSL
jgi:hypothetical protein